MKKETIAGLLAAMLVTAPGSFPVSEAFAQDAASIPANTGKTSGTQIDTCEAPGSPSGLLLLKDGSLLITDLYNKVIWRQKDGKTEILAGKQGIKDVSGIPLGSYKDDVLKESGFSSPWAAAIYLEGVAVTDTENGAVRYLGPSRVYTLAQMESPTGIAADDSGNLYVADRDSSSIQKIDAKGTVTLYAGGKDGCADGVRSDARFREPTGLAWQGGSLYIADSGNHRICRITGDKVETLAGAAALGDAVYQGGYVDGGAKIAQFSNPQGIAVSEDGVVYVADTGNSLIRVIRDGVVSTLYSQEDSKNGYYPVSPRGILLQDRQLMVADTFAQQVFQVPLSREIKTGFSDVKASDWYAPAVNAAAEHRLLQGTGPDAFSPDGTVNRAAFAAVLGRMETSRKGADVSGTSQFSDVKSGSWYADAAAWSVDSGLMKAVEKGQFAPDNGISRQDVAVSLFQYAALVGVEEASGKVVSLDIFADRASVASDAVPALNWAVSQGVLQGVGGGLLEPNRAITRAELAQILLKALPLLNQE